ncbi:oleandomycin transport system permease protein [Kitasatospora sp. MAA4]|uniref:ABC transporter permease n=1 Tax=Kitasatospora sp. MAA4 TaxID=3035093 RepID=UPI002473758F|nr:ABC transporter permease [Kitasatospora sp. MAA4]MDH6135768.1 oleandomycin transport system permease protein [Kitasatospora sp. MAA4]
MAPLTTARTTLAGLLAQWRLLAWRHLLPLRNHPGQLAGYLAQPAVMLGLFVYLPGGPAVGGDHRAALAFALPGVLVQSALTATVVTGTRLHADLRNGYHDRLRALPTHRGAPLVGLLVADLATTLLSTAVCLGLGFVLGFRFGTSRPEVLAGLALVVLFSAAVTWGSILVGLLARSATTAQLVGLAVLLPLTIASTACLNGRDLPPWVRGWLYANPVSHVAQAVRGLLVGHPYDERLRADTSWALLWSLTLVVVLAPPALGAYRQACRTGLRAEPTPGPHAADAATRVGGLA